VTNFLWGILLALVTALFLGLCGWGLLILARYLDNPTGRDCIASTLMMGIIVLFILSLNREH
jgi:hypothetical protein